MKNLLLTLVLFSLVACAPTRVTSVCSPATVRPTKDTTTVVQHVDPGLPRDEDVMHQ